MSSKFIRKNIEESYNVKAKMVKDNALLTSITDAADNIIAAYNNGKKVLVAGNGGSAADAQHISGELISRFYFSRPGLAAIALHTDTSTLTAIGNDYGYEYVFARQIEANGVTGDVFIALSTSGNSPNILHAIRAAKTKGISVIGMTGSSGGAMDALCDICIKIPSTNTPRIQEGHMLTYHAICGMVEEKLFATRYRK